MQSWKRATGVLMALLAVFCGGAYATDGAELVGFGAISKSLGGAGVAHGKDTAWMLINPGAITALESRMDFMVGVYAPRWTLEPHGLAGNGFAGKMRYNDPIGGADTGFIWHTDDYTLGTGIFTVAGFTAEYPSSRTIVPKLTLGNWDRRLRLINMRMPFTIAHRFENGWSLGLSLNLNYQQMRTDNISLHIGETKGHLDWDQSYGAGFAIGAQKNWGKLGFGAAYTSRQWMSRFDKYTDVFKHSLHGPQKVQVGFSYQITPKLEAVLDYKWIDWRGVPEYRNGFSLGGVGWHSQHLVKGGLAYEINDRWTVRAGASYGNRQMNSEVVFADALAPLLTKVHLATGFTYVINDHSEISADYLHLVHDELTERGTGSLFGFLGKGTKISSVVDSVSVGYTYKF